MNTKAIVTQYLRTNLILDVSGTSADLDSELDQATTLAEITEIVKAAKCYSMGEPNLIHMYQRNKELPASVFIDAEIYLRGLKDIVYPTNRTLVMCKIDTGGMAGYQHSLRGKGEDILPLLQVTLKIPNRPAKTVWINPKGAQKHITPNTERFLNRNGILKHAIAHGIDVQSAELELYEYLDSNDVLPNNPSNDNIVQLVCSSASMYRAFLNAKMSNLSNYFSPKYVDVTPYNNVLESMGLHHAMCYARYETDPVKYVEALELYMNKARKG